MQWGASSSEYGDLTIRPITSEGTGDRGSRRPPWERARDEEARESESEDAFDLEIVTADLVTLGSEQPVAADGSDRTYVRLSLVPFSVLGLDLQTHWAALVEAATVRPAFRLWRARRHDFTWRRLRRSTRLPLGVPFTPTEAVLSSLS